MNWADGYLVTESKVVKWLVDVVFQIRKDVTKKAQGARKLSLTPQSLKPIEITLTDENIKWGASIGKTREELLALLEQDRLDLEVDSVLDPDTAEALEGDFFKWDTVKNAYISAIAELYEFQVSTGTNSNPTFRGAALKALMETKRSQQDALSREQFEDRGAGGLNSSYSDGEFLRIHRHLLNSIPKRATVSTFSLIL